ncbi:MAG: hypothetical protein WCG83_03900 [Candidatus Peregrinibacteria bacterium]
MASSQHAHDEEGEGGDEGRKEHRLPSNTLFLVRHETLTQKIRRQPLPGHDESKKFVTVSEPVLSWDEGSNCDKFPLRLLDTPRNCPTICPMHQRSLFLGLAILLLTAEGRLCA